MSDKSYFILVVNPGSTTTKVSYFVDEKEEFHKIITHNKEDLSRFNKSSDQDLFRMEIIVKVLRENNINMNSIVAVVGRGGLLRPIEGGTYIVNEQMVADLKHGHLETILLIAVD